MKGGGYEEEEKVKEMKEKEKMKPKRKQEKYLEGNKTNNISFIYTGFPCLSVSSNVIIL